MCLLNFQGHLIAGVGKSLRLYEMGKKQLLRKCENSVSTSVLSLFHDRLVIRITASGRASPRRS